MPRVCLEEQENAGTFPSHSDRRKRKGILLTDQQGKRDQRQNQLISGTISLGTTSPGTTSPCWRGDIVLSILSTKIL